MSLTLVTAPTAEPISIEEFRVHARVTETEEDPYILQLIKGATDFIEGKTQRRLISQVVDWRLHGFDVEALQFPLAVIECAAGRANRRFGGHDLPA